MKKPVPILLFIIWLTLWINFIARDLFGRNHIYDYLILSGRDAEGKRAYTYGEHFYEFLKFAKNIIPQGAGYKLVGPEGSSDSAPGLAYRRGVYYLYPLVVKENPGYILVYNIKGYTEDGFALYAGFNGESFILKKR